MFGIKIVTQKKLAQIKTDAQNQAIADLVALLRMKDKIYTEPVTLVGDGQKIINCAFFGIGGDALTVMPINKR